MSESDAPEGATPGSGDPSEGKPKRRGRVKKRHTVGRVLLVTSVVLALVTGLSTLYLYRHYNGNLDVIDVGEQIVDRPEKKKVEGPKEPLNILVMGSDDRDAPGNNIDNLTGGGKRSDTTILLHLSADRKRAYGISIPRDSLVNRPECLDEDLDPIPGGTDVMWNEAFSVGGPACTVHQVEQLTGIRDRPLRRRRLRGVPRHGRRHRRRPGLHPRAGHPATRPTASTSRPAPASSRASRPSTTCASATRWATAPTSAG